SPLAKQTCDLPSLPLMRQNRQPVRILTEKAGVSKPRALLIQHVPVAVCQQLPGFVRLEPCQPRLDGVADAVGAHVYKYILRYLESVARIKLVRRKKIKTMALRRER